MRNQTPILALLFVMLTVPSCSETRSKSVMSNGNISEVGPSVLPHIKHQYDLFDKAEIVAIVTMESIESSGGPRDGFDTTSNFKIVETIKGVQKENALVQARLSEQSIIGDWCASARDCIKIDKPEGLQNRRFIASFSRPFYLEQVKARGSVSHHAYTGVGLGWYLLSENKIYGKESFDPAFSLQDLRSRYQSSRH